MGVAYTNNERSTIVMLAVFALVAAFYASFLGFGNPISDFREAQVASTIRIYADEGIDLLYPKLNVMGDPGYFVLEFPIYQAMVALVWGLFGLREVWGELLSHLFWGIGTFYLYFLCRQFADQRIAIVTAVLFLFAPIALLYSSAVGIEPMSVCLSIAFLYYGTQWVRTRRLASFGLALAIAIVGFLQKSPNMAPMYIPLIAMLYIHNEKQWKSVVLSLPLILLGAIPLVLLVMWQQHADSVNAMYPASERFVLEKMRPWLFGTTAQKLNPLTYIMIMTKSVENALGSVYAGVLMLIGVVFARQYYFFFFWLVAYGVAALVFTNLHSRHIHYMIPFLAPQVFFAAVGLVACWDRLHLPQVGFRNHVIDDRWLRRAIVTSGVVCVIVWNGMYMSMRGMIYNDYDTRQQADIIQQHVPRDSRIMLYWAAGQRGGTWSPVLMYLADRRGVTIRLNELGDGNLLTLMDANGTDYLVLAGESLRFLFAAGKQTNRILLHFHPVEYVLENVRLRFSPQVERQLAVLTPVSLGERLRIYRKSE